MVKAADVVIIGGGVTGVSTAFSLMRKGAKGVVLVEKDFIASGPTGKSSACVRQHYSNVETARMVLRSLEVFEHFDEVVGGECGFVKTGYLLGVPEALRKSMEASVRLQQEVGIKTRVITPQEMRAIEPRVRVDDFAAGCYEPDSGYADPVLTATGFATRAREMGATILQQTEVTDILVEAGRVRGVRTTKGEISAPAVVNAAGAWGARIARQVGFEIPITVCRHKIHMVRRPTKVEAPHPMVYDFVQQVYTRPEAGGLTLFGSLDPTEVRDTADPDRYDGSVDLDSTIRAMEIAVHRFPSFAEGFVAKGYSGVFDVTPDWHPVLDEMPGLRGLYCAVGFSGHGFKLSPAVGMAMADLVLHGKQPGSDIALFNFRRFQEGRPIRGKYDEGLMC